MKYILALLFLFTANIAYADGLNANWAKLDLHHLVSEFPQVATAQETLKVRVQKHCRKLAPEERYFLYSELSRQVKIGAIRLKLNSGKEPLYLQYHKFKTVADLIDAHCDMN